MNDVATLRRWLAVALLLAAPPVLAEVNLVWTCASTTSLGRGVSFCSGSWSWQRGESGRIVASHTSAGSYESGTWRRWEEVAPSEYVFVCTADIPVGAGAGCPRPGVYTDERYLLKSSLPSTAPSGSVSLTATKTDIVEGESVTLTWTSAFVTSCTNNFGGQGTAGSRVVDLLSTTTFSISCNGQDGKTYTSAVTVNVAPAPPDPWSPTAASCYLEGAVDWHLEWTAGGEAMVMNWCDTRDGLEHNWRAGHLLSGIGSVQAVANKTVDELRKQDEATFHRAPTDAEYALHDQIAVRRGPRCFTAATGSGSSTPVYRRGADGGLGSRLQLSPSGSEPAVDVSVAVNVQADCYDWITSGQNKYCAVDGLPAVTPSGAIMPGDAYARCSLVKAPDSGW